jgi:hypothetical protein
MNPSTDDRAVESTIAPHEPVRAPLHRVFPSLVALCALGAGLLLPLTAHAETCVTIDEQRDGLNAEERSSARTLFEETLSENQVSVARERCSETWTLYHVRLGKSITIVVQSPRGNRRERVERVEDLSGMYSQIVKSIQTGIAGSSESPVIDRRNVTDTQTANNRVAADAIWYGRLGYGASPAAGFHGGPAFGIGRRWELDRVALDLSFLNLTLYQDSKGYEGVGGSWIKFGVNYFFNPYSNYTPYVGAGLGFGSNTLQRDDKVEFKGSGLQGELSVGYEMFRASTLRLFVQADASLPMYRLSGNVPSADGMTQESHRYAPMFTISLGLGWGKPRQEVVVTQR